MLSNLRFRNIAYLFLWGIVTLGSSYNMLLVDLDFHGIIDYEGDYNLLCVPLILWMIGYYLDYVYDVVNIKKDEYISPKSILASAWAMALFLGFLVLIICQTSFILSQYFTNVNLSGNIPFRDSLRTIGLMGMFLCIMYVKWQSLSSIQVRIDVTEK